MIKSNQNKYDFLTNFITEEKYLQNPPLETNKFIEFCRIRGIETDRKELEYFEKEKVLFPICQIDLPFIKEEHCLVDKDGNKIKKHIIRYSYHGFQAYDKKLLSEFLKKGNLYDVLKKPFKDWACFKDDTGREKTLSFYSSYQIYWLLMLKRAFSTNVRFIGDCIKIISYLPVKYKLSKRQFSISKNQSNCICSEIKKMSQEKTYEKYFNLEKKIEEVRKEYQKYCKILKFLLNIQNPYYLYAKYASKTMTISGRQEKWIQLKKGFKLDNELKNLGIQIDDIVEWYWAFSMESRNILGASKGDWTQLWKNISWNKKEKLEGKTRLGIDYLQWAIMLKRAIEDYLGREILDIDELDKHKWDDILKEKTNRWVGRIGSLRSIRNERYLDISIKDGKELRSVYNKILEQDKDKIEIENAFIDYKKLGFCIDWQDKSICFGKNLNIKNYYHDKYKRLFYLLNSFDLDCQAKVIVFVEGGSEEKILPKIFQWYFGILPDRYGIEFINFRGVSQLLSTSENATELRDLINKIEMELKEKALSGKNRQKLNEIIRRLKKLDIIISNWTSFLSYNLEKWQIIPFFLSDDEGDIKKFLDAGQPIRFDRRNYNIPREWYFLWGKDNQDTPYKGNNFELANYNDNEISAVLSKVLKKNIDNHKIELIRNGGKGIKAIEPETIGKNKVLINEKLFDYVCKKYEENKEYNLLERPVFKVIDKVMDLALVNHFPIDRRMELENKEYIKGVLKNQPKIT